MAMPPNRELKTSCSARLSTKGAIVVSQPVDWNNSPPLARINSLRPHFEFFIKKAPHSDPPTADGDGHRARSPRQIQRG